MPENNMKIIICEMQPEDVSAVAALEAECFSEPWSEQAFLDALKQSEAMMMVAVGMGNNPMVGATVAVAVGIEEAAKAGKF